MARPSTGLESAFSRLFCLSTTLLHLVLSFTLTAPLAPVSAYAIPRSQLTTQPTSPSTAIRRTPSGGAPHSSWTRQTSNTASQLTDSDSSAKRCINVSIDDDGDESWDGDGNASLIALLSLPCVEVCVEGKYVWGKCRYQDLQVCLAIVPFEIDCNMMEYI